MTLDKKMTLPLLAIYCARAWAQGPQADQTPPPPDPERWNIFYQATSIGDYHGTFTSPYASPFSLQSYPEKDVSLTTTLFFAFRLQQDTYFYFDPEIAGGKG